MIIKKIGIENFRVFKEYTEFEIRPITLLTGPNNSGKSSFTKLLLLLQNNLSYLRFEEGRHNINNFESAVNRSSKEKRFHVTYFTGRTVLGKETLLRGTYKNAKLSEIQLESDKLCLLSVTFSEKVKDHFIHQQVEGEQHLKINIELLIHRIYEQNIEMPIEIFKETGESEIRYKPLGQWDKSTIDFSSMGSDEDLYWRISEKYGEESKYHIASYLMAKEIKTLKKDFLLFRLFYKGKDITAEYQEELLEVQRDTFNNLYFKKGNFSSLKDKFEFLHDLLEDVWPLVVQEIQDHFKNIMGERIELKESTLGKLVFSEKFFTGSPSAGAYFQESLWNKISSIPSHARLLNYNQFHYLSPNRANQQRILQNESSNDINKIVLDFSKRNQSLMDTSYLQEVFSVLEVPGEIKIERFLDYISVLYLEKDGEKTALPDLGFGFSQLIPIVLKIFNLFQNEKNSRYDIDKHLGKALIIEEPEANLHPNLQSKLADVLALTLRYYPSMKILIETHSEYLIRKLQYLTAKKELQSDQSVIYYFNADKYVSYEEPKVKRINITPTGNLTDTFGPGFFDEATRLQFDLMNINREQKN